MKPGIAAATGQRMLRLLQNVQSAERRVARHPALCLAVLVILLGTQISPFWYPSDDGAGYFSIAQAYASGQSLAHTVNGEAGLPPAYPALLSVMFGFGPRPFLAISFLHFFIGILSAIGLWLWSRRLVGSSWVFVCGVTMLGASYTFLHRRTLKECLFLALLVWTGLVMQWALESRARRRAMLLAALSCLMLGILVLIRYASIALLPAFMIGVWRVHRQRLDRKLLLRLAVLAIVPLSALVGHCIYQTRVAQANGSSTYLQTFMYSLTQLADSQRVLESARIQINDCGRIVVPGMFKSYSRPFEWANVNTLVYLALSVGLLVGYIRACRRNVDVLLLAAPIYLAAYLVWAQDQGGRFMVPMTPVLIVCLIQMCRHNGAWQCGLLSRQRGNRQPARVRWLRQGLAVSQATLTLMLFLHVGVGLGYQQLVDVPRAAAAHTSWNDFDRIEPLVFGQPTTVVASDLSYEQLMIARVISGQSVVNLPAERLQSEGETRWLLTTRESSLPAGFEVQYSGHEIVAAVSRPVVATRPSEAGRLE